MEDDQNGRRPKWKTTKMEDDQNGRRPKWKTTKMEDDQNEGRPKWKTTKMEDDQNGRRPKWKWNRNKSKGCFRNACPFLTNLVYIIHLSDVCLKCINVFKLFKKSTRMTDRIFHM